MTESQNAELASDTGNEVPGTVPNPLAGDGASAAPDPAPAAENAENPENPENGETPATSAAAPAEEAAAPAAQSPATPAPAPAPATVPAANGVRYVHEGGLATITLARPEARNSMDTATKLALRDAVLRAASDPLVRCVLLTAEGPSFCVGQDLREHEQLLAAGEGAGPDPQVWDTVREHYNPIVHALATMAKPVVAAVQGIAAGAGAGFAFAADVRLLGESGGFNLAFTGIGLTADSGASWTLPRLVGYGRAVDLLLRPRTVRAAEALELGLATRVVPDADLAAEALALATELAEGPTVAYAAVRQSLAYAAAHELADSLDREAELQVRCGTTTDHRDAVTAFTKKQKPVFEGR